MTRYVKQRDAYSCGPVAIMNVLKWAGQQFAYQDKIARIQWWCKNKKKRGTNHLNFDRALRHFGKHLNIKRVYYPKLHEIEAHLNQGGIVVLTCITDKTKIRGISYTSRHFVLIDHVSKTGKTFFLINSYSNTKARVACLRTTLKKLQLRYQRVDSHYKAWFINKRK